MRWVVLWVMAGCVGQIEGIGAPDGSAVSPAPVRPLACDVESTDPLLPRICAPDGWCWEVPATGPIDAFAVGDHEKWLAIGLGVVRIADDHVEWFPSPGRVRALYAVTPGPVALAGTHAYRLEGRTWTKLGDTEIVELSVAADGAIWGITATNGVARYAGSWVALSIPVPGTVRALSAASTDEVWISLETDHAEHVVVHLTEHGFKTHRETESVVALRAVGPDDVWVASPTHITHCAGGDQQVYDVTGATSLVARSTDDVWALGYANDVRSYVAHFDGAAWSTCGDRAPWSAAVGERDELWTLAGQALGHYAGGWSASPLPSNAVDLEVLDGSDERLALTSDGTVLRRTADARWHVDLAASYLATKGLASSSANDVWAFGPLAAHFDGTSWTWPSISFVSDLCVLRSGTAIAATNNALQTYTSTGWSTETDFESDGRVHCLPDGDVWASGKGIAHREAGTWHVSAAVDNVTAPFAPPGGPLYSLGFGIARFANGEWQQVKGPTTDIYLGAAGTSPTDLWFLASYSASAAHYNGQTFDRFVPAAGVKQIRAIAGDDLFLFGSDFRTWRSRGDVQTLVAAAAPADSLGNDGYGEGTVWLSSATSGLATSAEGHLLRFDGSSWTRITAPAAHTSLLTAFSDNDVYVIADRRALAHWNGRRWTTTPLPVTSDVVAVWGASATDLWLASTTGEIVRVLRGTPQVITTAEPPHELWRIGGSRAEDVWFSGNVITDASSNTVTDMLWHWDGTRITRQRAPRDVQRMRRLGGSLLAEADDPLAGREIWEHLSTGWQLRPDLTVDAVFPAPARRFPGARVIEESPEGPWWAISDYPGFILRAE